MEQDGGYSRKLPPSQNPACTLLVGALPKSSLLGIPASPSFAAESNKSIFWLLERFPEFRVFFTRVLLFIKKLSHGLAFLAIEFSIKLIQFICVSSMITNKMLILSASEIPDPCACFGETLPSSDLKADNVQGLKHHEFCKVLYGTRATHFKSKFLIDGALMPAVKAENVP